jgi:heme-binding NEAT domain protein
MKTDLSISLSLLWHLSYNNDFSVALYDIIGTVNASAITISKNNTDNISAVECRLKANNEKHSVADTYIEKKVNKEKR